MHKFIQTILLLTCFTFAVNTQAQIINIPDANFKAKLLEADTINYIAKDSLGHNMKIDINNDGEIEQSEAFRVSDLYLGYSNFKSIIGVSNFINLKNIVFDHCDSVKLINLESNNNLVNIDITYCVKLDSITAFNLTKLLDFDLRYCYNVKYLDISNCINIDILSILDNYKLEIINIDSCDRLRFLLLNNAKIKYLNLSHFNYLSNFNVDYLDSLKYIDVSNCINLQVCRISNLRSLNEIFANGCINLQIFKCESTTVKEIYIKNGINNSQRIFLLYYSVYGNPNLKYICTDAAEFFEFNKQLNNQNRSGASLGSFCNIYIGVNYRINGKIKYSNNICTSLDPVYPYLKININNAVDTNIAISDEQGNFAMVLDSGTYTLKPQLQNNYFIATPTSTTITLPKDTIPQQFCITPNGIHHDVSVTIIPLRDARPGFSDATYKIVIKNKGNQIENGTVLFNYDESRQDYISSTSTPLSLSSGELIFSFSNLQLFATYEIIVTMRTNAPTDNPAVNVGDVIQLSVTANLDNGTRDEFFKDNFQNIRQTVVGSFDPNDKTCLEGDIITPTLVGDFVHYLIRFENTGTANAENIVVTDFIDLNTFDISTLEITSTSHNCKTLISNGNKVQFVFDNINLPFTEPLKHGYVAFKLKLKNNLGIGDSLKNKADIYFDYNLPITTNTADSRIDNITVIKTNANKEGSLSLYPNPSNGNFIVNFESPVRQTIIVKIVAINGNVVYEQNLYHNYQSQLQLNQNLPAGVYLITVNSEKEQYTQKLIITK